MANNHIALRKRHCLEIEANSKVVHRWTTRQLATVAITMPNGEPLVRRNLNMPEYKMPESWRV
eukprot:5452855-Karenia_brevis.AAC.1